MIVYHASTVQVTNPDTFHSRDALDFGKGFYFTTLKDQAIKYGNKFLIRKKKAWLNIYEFKEDWSKWNVKVFPHYDEEWLDYITACRRLEQHNNFDMVIGGIADDKVFTTVNLYFANFIKKDEALRRLEFEKPNNQFCIRNEEMLKECITYINAIEL